MSAPLLGVRVSPELRRLIAAAGDRLNPATRALLILGAAAAGQDVRPLASTIHVLIDAGELSGPTVAALRQLVEGVVITSDITRDNNRDSTPPAQPARASLLADLLNDPLDEVGIEV